MSVIQSKNYAAPVADVSWIQPSADMPATSPSPNDADLHGLPTSYSGTPASTMSRPRIDGPSMMLALTRLQGQVTDQNVKTASDKIEGFKDDIKKLNAERAKQLEAHFNKLSEASRPQKCGLFGLIVRFFKTCIESIKHPEKSKELWNDFGTLAKNSVLDIIKDVLAIAAAVAGAALACTGVGTALGMVLIAAAVCLVVSTALSDPEVVRTIVNCFPPEKQENARKVMGYVSLALTLLSVALSIAGGVGSAVSAAKAVTNVASKVVNTVLQTTSGIVSGGTSIYTAVDGKKATDSRVEAEKSGAKSEKIAANILTVEENMATELNSVKSFMESYQKTIESTLRMLTSSASAQRAIASV